MINSITLVGNVGADAEIKYFDSGKQKATFNLAVARPRRRGEEEVTDWFRVEVWGKTAEIAAEYVKKGKQVGVVGPVEFESYTDKDGIKRQAVAVKANELRLGANKDKATAPAGGRSGGDLDDEIPY